MATVRAHSARLADDKLLRGVYGRTHERDLLQEQDEDERGHRVCEGRGRAERTRAQTWRAGCCC